MSFEKVNVSTLRSAIYACTRNLDNSSSTSAKNDFSSNEVWQGNAKTKLVNALDNLINTKYKNLLNELYTCSSVASLIDEYKDLENENSNMRQKIDRLYNDLYYEKCYTFDNQDQDTFEKVKDLSVESEIDSLNAAIAKNREKMSELEARVANLVE